MKMIFQKRVLEDYLKKQDEKLIGKRWKSLQKYQNNKFAIKDYKEESYQTEFLQDIFEKCLGYTLKPTNPRNFNIEREKKNEHDSKKADGAIYVNELVIGVIELKSCSYKSKDFDKKPSKEQPSLVDQAFGYFNSHSNCKYVIVSNFDTIRFYINNKTEYEEYSLFNMDYNEFRKLHTILSFESIKNDLPLEIKAKSVTFEVDISNKFYKDYVKFRTELFENILEKNKKRNKLELLNLTQKLIDRIVFILFAEDTTLLPLNTIYTIIKNHKEHNFEDKSLYEFYQIYFNAINKGSENLNINKYNGGLFAQDERLDTLKIDDTVLHVQAEILSAYNFGSDISVNILGHIFEQSISDLEELTAQINEDSFDKKQSKRKKDGIFYTPAYITSYIVENTLGKICIEKREELNLLHVETLASGKKATKKITKQKEDLTTYKEWITNLKILDPACGSGAFLNQALEFLLQEHKNIQNDFQKLGDILSNYEIDKTILENNLYGVDINESAVEIAKLSLWLKTANNKRPLTKLANKIKCGNSLIDDKKVVKNAFVWEEEFPEVFENGGFDVVIGNPPYVRNTALPKEDKKFYDKSYFVAYKQYDLYVLFNELALKLTKNDGLIGFIQPNKFLSADYGINTLNFIVENAEINFIKNVSLDKTFEDASVYPYIFIYNKKSFNKDIEIKNISIFDVCEKNNLIGFETQLKSIGIINKINTLSMQLSEITTFIKRGVPNNKLIFSLNGKYNAVSSTDLSMAYSLNNISNHIEYKNTDYECTKNSEFSKSIILLPRTVLNIRAILSTDGTHILDRIYYISINDQIKINIKTILLLLNSKITTFFYDYFYGSTKIGGGYIDLKGTQISTFPIIKNISNEDKFIQKSNLMLKLTKNLQETKQNFIADLELEKVPKKLQNFDNLTFEEFIKELKKVKKLKFETKLQERELKDEWRGLFEKDTKEVLKIKSQIDKTDKEIDKMVYELYGLSDEEIALVEGNL